jgi:hypothetical protein
MFKLLLRDLVARFKEPAAVCLHRRAGLANRHNESCSIP